MKMIYFTYFVTKQMKDTIFLYVDTKYKCLVIVVFHGTLFCKALCLLPLPTLHPPHPSIPPPLITGKLYISH